MKRLLLIPLAAATALATGDYYEESVPTLKVYLSYDRLPKKSILDIAREVKPVGAAKEPEYAKEIPAIAAALKGGKAPKELLPKIDALIEAERARAFRAGSGLNSLLHDLRDLCSGPADAVGASGYVEWRLTNGHELGYTVESGYEKPQQYWEKPEEPSDEFLKKWKTLKDAAPEAVKPHYLYAYAAYTFRLGNDVDSQAYFEDVVEAAPEHPRAEVALYMVGRCLSRQSRFYKDDGYKNDEAKVAEARKAMEGYLKKYPEGRFVGDVLGWLGGLEMNAQKYAEALPFFVKMLNVPGHPEYAVSATKEIEACFRALHENPDALAKALSEPIVAQAAVYFASNEIEPVDGNGEYESPEFVAEWRKKLFPAVAAALSKQADLFKAPGWQPRYVASLVLAASGAGEQEQALKLLEGVDASATDDLAFARAVVLQRAKRLPEAVEAYRLVAKKFPDSILTPGSRVREALVLVDDRKAGEAAFALMAIDQKKKVAKPVTPSLPQETPPLEEEEEEYQEGETRDLDGVDPADKTQVKQLLDTIFNFAPVAELASAASNEKAPEEFRVRLKEIVAIRHLTRERFAEAQPFMPPAQWEQVAGPLAKLTTAAAAAKTPAEKAAAAMKVGDAWAAARGKLLTVPLDTEEWRRAVFKDDHAVANSTRIENAAALGLTGATAIDLENRDELRHAFNAWIAASDVDPKKPQAATAVWRALRAMPDIATVSEYSLERAQSKKWNDVSRKLYDRLQKEYPTSPEAKRLAVWWSLPPGKQEDGSRVYRGEFVEKLEKADPGGEETPDEEVLSQVAKVLPAAETSVADFGKTVAAGHKWARASLHGLPSQCVVNFFEDLDLFAATPGLTHEVVKKYATLRYDTLLSSAIGYTIFPDRKGEEKKDDPGTVRGDDALLAEIRATQARAEFAGVADYLSFLELAVTANHWVSISMKDTTKQMDKNGEEPTYWGRDYVAMERMCREWLAKYPKSKKREAAMLLHCRALRHAMEPYIYYKRASWPISPRWEGAELAEKVPRMKFDAKVWKAALDQYDKEFPKGRFADDVLGYRADLGVRLKDWKRALQITLAQAKGKEHLHPNSQNRLRTIFAQLAKDEDRADLLTAIRAIPGARAALEEELGAAEDISDHPLLVLKDWLAQEAQQ